MRGKLEKKRRFEKYNCEYIWYVCVCISSVKETGDKKWIKKLSL